MHTKKMSFNGVNECFQELINNMLPLSVFSLYVYLGNEMSMSQIVLTTIMLNKVKDKCRHATHVYEMFKEVTDSMKKIQKYYASDEVQASIVRNVKDSNNNTALRLKGNFSWGFEKQEKDKEEDEESEKKGDEKKDSKLEE